MTAGTTATAAGPATATAHAGPSRGRPARVWVEQIMGMPVSVHVRGRDAEFGPDVDTAVAQAFSHLRRVDAVFSTWRPDSDLRRVRRGELVESAAHPWLAEVRALCERAEHSTVGLFSATAGSGGSRVYDPTGLVKGWAVEGAARHLALASGIAFCVNAGGDILAGTPRRPGPRAVAHRRRGPAPAHPDRRDRRAGRRRRRHVGQRCLRRAHP